MKVVHVTYNLKGGAGIAAARIHNALKKNNVDSTMIFIRGSIYSQNRGLFGPIKIFINKLANRVFSCFTNKLISKEPTSINLLRTGVHQEINRIRPDIVHFHWINGEMLSIEEVGKIAAPIVWTLHDMWPFCGAEHYAADNGYLYGYKPLEKDIESEKNQPLQIVDDDDTLSHAYASVQSTDPELQKHKTSRLRINRWVWLRKRKNWNRVKIHPVGPSLWIADCARQSLLWREQKVTVIKNCVDTDIYRPLNVSGVRAEMGFPEEKHLVLFGAVSVLQRRKGNDLMIKALEQLPSSFRGELELLIFGKEGDGDLAGIKTHWLGRLEDDEDMARIYNIVDFFICPSRIDNLPNTCVESISCGTPVVAFDVGGISEIVEHRKQGYLAEAENATDLANGIQWVLGKKHLPANESPYDLNKKDSSKTAAGNEDPNYEALCKNAREKALRNFSPDEIAKEYIENYKQILKNY